MYSSVIGHIYSHPPLHLVGRHVDCHLFRLAKFTQEHSNKEYLVESVSVVIEGREDVKAA